MHFANYLKTAFLNHWNLLCFLGGCGFALLTGHADATLPLVLAVELGYLGLLASNPKFQKYVDAQQAAIAREANAESTQNTLQRIMRSLPAKMVERFDSLRSRCFELRQLSAELKRPGEQRYDVPLEDAQLVGLDRLLWLFLRLLYTDFALSRFLQKTSADDIQREADRTQKRLAALPPSATDVQSQRIRKTLEDNVATCQERLANLKKAQDNLQLVELQIDQLENRIRSLSEMAVNRQEPEFITTQVDQVTGSIVQTEQTMNELRFATGLETIGDEPPRLLRPVMAKEVE